MHFGYWLQRLNLLLETICDIILVTSHPFATIQIISRLKWISKIPYEFRLVANFLWHNYHWWTMIIMNVNLKILTLRFHVVWQNQSLGEVVIFRLILFRIHFSIQEIKENENRSSSSHFIEMKPGVCFFETQCII